MNVYFKEQHSSFQKSPRYVKTVLKLSFFLGAQYIIIVMRLDQHVQLLAAI